MGVHREEDNAPDLTAAEAEVAENKHDTDEAPVAPPLHTEDGEPEPTNPDEDGDQIEDPEHPAADDDEKSEEDE